jgi:Protein kinase domain
VNPPSDQTRSRERVLLPSGLHQAAVQFDAAWHNALRGATRPRIEDYLHGIAGPGYVDLLKVLVAIELECRRNAGDKWSADDYTSRFSEQVVHLREILEAATAASHTAPAHTANLAANDLPKTDRFELQRQIGAGAMGIVYEALDRDLGTTVALKLLPHVNAQALYRFKQEFRALVDIVHPNLVRLYELFADGERWFFTMELIDGVNFLAYTRPHGPAGLPSSARDVGGEYITRLRPVTSARPRSQSLRARHLCLPGQSMNVHPPCFCKRTSTDFRKH